MIKKKLLTVILFNTLLFSEVVVPDNYIESKGKKVNYIYTQSQKNLLPDIKDYQKSVILGYEKEFGFELDDELSVGLASNNNQIANGFSTQIPFNMQLFYGAGASYIDYFCFSSWLKTLLIHETAHNFQLNPKENTLSKISHKVLGNTPLSSIAFIPLFPIPNIMESSFILEGNAVLNESRFGNGGRLFSGYALAEVVALARAGKIRPELMYNSTLEFPYGEKFYLVGGFFQQFLAKRYGIEKVNGYFKTFSTQAFPFFTNSIFQRQFGKDFETLLTEFSDELLEEHKEFHASTGKIIARSQSFVPFNVTNNEIYTLVSDKRSAPKILLFDKLTKNMRFKSGSWRFGEVFKYKNKYYTQSSAKTSPVKIEMGLFDEDGFIEKAYASKAVQGFTKSGKTVYFDVAKSIESPQVYLDDKFYTECHSSVYVKGDDLYYFKQEGTKRTLYKNKTAIISYSGYYGFVSDVAKDGLVYFIALSKHGSSVYRVKDTEVERVSLSDDIIDFKLIDNHKALVATVDDNGYAYRVISFKKESLSVTELSEVTKEKSWTTSIAQKGIFGKEDNRSILESKPYNAFLDLKYSSLNQTIYYESYTGFNVGIQANFADPLLQNSLSFVLSHNNKRDIAGVRYDNEAHLLKYGAALYGVSKENRVVSSDMRDLGYEAHLTLPLLASGYWRANTQLEYNKPYNNIYRKPMTLSLNILNQKQFALSKYSNSLNTLSLFITKDRNNNIFGGDYSFKHDLIAQIYVGAKALYMKSAEVDYFNEKGIELRDGLSLLQADKASVDVPSFSRITYAKELKMGELSLAKVFDSSFYFYSFPLSLQRESFYAKQRIYDIDFTNSSQHTYSETLVGAEFDFLFLHQLTIPLGVEWVHNRDVVDQDKVRFVVGGSF